MVDKISKDVRDEIHRSVRETEKRTDAEIMLVVTPSSDHYQAQVMVYGLGLGTLASLALWAGGMKASFPQLLLLQLSVMTLVTFVPFLHRLAVHFVPARIKRHLSARRAHEEFVFAGRHVPASKPLVLLYVSLAERYVHVLRSRAVPEKVPEAAWEKLVAEFTAHMKKGGLREACLAAVESMAHTLEAPFPREADRAGLRPQ